MRLDAKGLKLLGSRFCTGWIVATVEVGGNRQTGLSSSGANEEPPTVESIIKRCLEKDPYDRWQSTRDVWHALEMSGAAAGIHARRPIAWITISAVSALIAVAALAMLWRQAPPDQSLIQFQVNPPAGAEFPGGIGGGGSAISPRADDDQILKGLRSDGP